MQAVSAEIETDSYAINPGLMPLPLFCPFLNQTATIKAKQIAYKFAAVCMEVIENVGFD
jgi:hypothetical protein